MRRYVIFFTIGWLLPAAIIILINGLVDPYRLFHKPWVHDNYYPRNLRILASGIINTEAFDSIILGSSIAQNFSPNEASKVFGSKFVNISISGSSITERSLVLNYALKKRKLNEVIYSLDWGSLGIDSISKTHIAPYAYLYDNNSWNDILIYASNPAAFRFAFCNSILISGDNFCTNSKDIESLVEWHSDKEYSKRFGGLHKWFDVKNNNQVQGALKSISQSIKAINSSDVKKIDLTKLMDSKLKHQQVFRANLLNIIAQHPEIKFYLFFPPYSRLNYAITKQSDPQKFEDYLEILRFVVNECAQHSNVKVYGFETELFLDDISNYRDTLHYHQHFNSKMLHWMKKGDHELTPSNLNAYINIISERADSYPLGDIGRQIESFLNLVP